MYKKKILIMIGLILIIIGLGSLWYIFYGGSNSINTASTAANYSPTNYASSSKDIVDYINANSSLSNFGQLIEAAGLTSQLQASSAASKTLVIVPNNAAFKASLPASYSSALLAGQNQTAAQNIAKYNVATLSTNPKNITNGEAINTLDDQQIIANLNGSTLSFTDAKGDTATVTAGPIVTSNGTIYVVNHVLLPQ